MDNKRIQEMYQCILRGIFRKVSMYFCEIFRKISIYFCEIFRKISIYFCEIFRKKNSIATKFINFFVIIIHIKPYFLMCYFSPNTSNIFNYSLGHYCFFLYAYSAHCTVYIRLRSPHFRY